MPYSLARIDWAEMNQRNVILIVASAFFLLQFSSASVGENSQVYQKCLRKWAQQNCSTQVRKDNVEEGNLSF